MEGKIKAFRQRGQGGDCIIMRIDHNAGLLLIHEQCKGLPSLEVLAEKLEESASEPRFVLYIHIVKHRDGSMLLTPSHKESSFSHKQTDTLTHETPFQCISNVEFRTSYIKLCLFTYKPVEFLSTDSCYGGEKEIFRE